MKNINIGFTIRETDYRVRQDKTGLNLILERNTGKNWKREGYHSPYSLRYAILAIVTEDIKGELVELFREQNRLLGEIEKQINEVMKDTGQ